VVPLVILAVVVWLDEAGWCERLLAGSVSPRVVYS
jgi:hypothetical protein